MNIKSETYTGAIGRRKEAVARARLVRGNGTIIVNEKALKEYFPREEWQQIVEAPLSASGMQDSVTVSVKVVGGGFKGQAESARLAIARALFKIQPETRPVLKKLGYLSRDARVKERKKYGRKKARRSPQWSKR
jgi:small subunit ribosomal protein S9